MNKNKVIIWSAGIDSLFLGSNDVSGIPVQMSLWGSVFSRNGWEVYALTLNKENDRRTINDITFVKRPDIKYLNIIITPFFMLWTLIRIRPKLFIISGATRDAFYISLLSEFFSVRSLELLASDTDVQPGNEIINSSLDKKLYRFGLKRFDFIVSQNIRQKELLWANYSRESIIIPTVWEVRDSGQKQSDQKRETIMWVANFSKIKRPEWFLDLAERLPDYKFVMVGGTGPNAAVYNASKDRASQIKNLKFTGPLSLSDVNNLFTQARLLVCTSSIEGFPNTFVQAWANGIPIISTFDPSNVIQENWLGYYVTTLEQIITKIELLQDNSTHLKINKNIEGYFKDNHDVQIKYEYLVAELKLLQ